MILILDTSAAIETAMNRPKSIEIKEWITNSDWIAAPDLFVSEATNVYWKYHTFHDMEIETCEQLNALTIELVDGFISAKELYREAFALSCQLGYSVYDCLYLVLARRNNAYLATIDKKMKKAARQLNIKVTA